MPTRCATEKWQKNLGQKNGVADGSARGWEHCFNGTCRESKTNHAKAQRNRRIETEKLRTEK
jgi:hypothetical protein